nr:MAG TPA: Caspase [Caudoviricetes sp.]
MVHGWYSRPQDLLLLVFCVFSGHGLYQNICPRHVMFKTKAVIDVLSRIVSKI